VNGGAAAAFIVKNNPTPAPPARRIAGVQPEVAAHGGRTGIFLSDRPRALTSVHSFCRPRFIAGLEITGREQAQDILEDQNRPREHLQDM
jgi:hypothetical protein